MAFEQAKKVLQLTDARIRKFGSIDASTSHEIHDAIFKFQPFQTPWRSPSPSHGPAPIAPSQDRDAIAQHHQPARILGDAVDVS
jgi:hypothetical protein